MKRSIISPLCSALIVPGLGQVLNNQIKKGLVLFFAVFGILITGAVRFYHMFKTTVKGLALNELYPEMVISKLKAQDHTFLWFLFFLLIALWLYSVIDAFIVGRKLDLKQKNEIISDR